jgi:bacteriocin-like protein
MEEIMSKTNETSRDQLTINDPIRELQDNELALVSGGSSNLLRRLEDANKATIGNIR